MSEHDGTQQARAPEAINITVVRVRNLKGQKGDVVNTVVKLELGEKVLGESPKVECAADTPAEINFNTTVNCTFDDPMVLDDLASKPFLLTVTEVLPKEKKQKEEKTQSLGLCTFDLLPLVKGELKHKYTLIIHPVPGSPLESLPPEHPRPEVDVTISVNDPLQTETQLEENNLMTVTLESLYSPPDAWNTGGAYMYTVCLPVPVSSEKENMVVFPNGSLKAAADKEPPSKQKRWLHPGQAQGNAIYIPDRLIASDSVEDEDGDFKTKEDQEHRTSSEQDKPKIVWNTEKQCFLETSACKSLQEKIAKHRYWPLEVMRVAAPAGGKGGKKDDDSGVSFHGVVYVNMAPLLYPGVKRIRGAYKVYPFSEAEVYEKTKRKGTMADEAVRIANGMMTRNTTSPFPKAGKGGDKPAPEKKEKEVKKGKAPSVHDEASAMLKPADSGSEQDTQAPINVEGQQYVDAKSYVMFEINLTRPLVPKKAPEELAKRVAEYIPPRPLFPKRTNGAQKSVEEFHGQVSLVAGLILDEFRDLFGEEYRNGEMVQTNEAMEKRRQGLVYHLNSSGKYFAFKEQLKYAVVKIVREKYLKTTNFEDRDQLQAFLSELYVYLVDQMHIALSNALSLEDQTPVPEPLTDSEQLLHFAREAEVNENFEWATKYYQERIARYKNDPSCWFDYGTFCLYINDLTKAEECFKESISIDQKHLHSLLLYAIVCAMQEKHEEAETFFEAATSVCPKSILAWTLLGLFYDGVHNEIGAEMAFIEANKLNVSAAAAGAARASKLEEQQKEQGVKELESVKEGDEKVDEGQAERDSKVGSIQDVSDAPAIKEISATPDRIISAVDGSSTKSPKSSKPEKKLSVSKRGSMGSRVKSTESVNSAARSGGSRHVPSHTNTPQPAEPEPEVDPERDPTPVPSQSVYMEAVDFLLEVKAMPFAERALAHELLLPSGGPSVPYYIAYARLKLQRREFDEAEESIQQALSMDFQNADAWGLMGHVKYLVGDNENARDCYERTLSFLTSACEMHSIYLRLASIYLHEGKFPEAKTTFLMACKNSPSCVSWLGVGIACYRLDELSEAEDALSEANILNNYDPEVWGYLSLVCLKTSRQLEAEQAYKYALKLNLQDMDLLAEINQLQEEYGFGDPQL